MSTVYSTTVKNTRLGDVVTALGATGALVIGTSALSGATGVLATVPLANPAGTVSAGVLTLTAAGMTCTIAASGTAAKAELRDGSGVVVASGLTVGTSGTDIILGTVTLTAAVTLTVTSATITHG